MNNLDRWPSKDASYHESIHLAKWFQRRRFFRNQPIGNKNCFWRPYEQIGTDEQSLKKTLQGYSLPCFGSFGKAGSENFFLDINQSKIRVACSGHVCKWIGTKWAILIKGLPRMVPTKFRSIWPSGSRGDDLLEIDQSETRIACGGHVY